MNILFGDPLYVPSLDPDHDGLACESQAASTPAQARLFCRIIGGPVPKGNPLYRDYLDSNKDGMACETADVQAELTSGPNCAEIGRTNILFGDPQYAPKLDRDNDGIGCESGEYYAGQKGLNSGYAGDGPNCTEIGRTNIPIGDPQYAPKLDRDNDGIGCESGDGTYGLPATGR